MSAHDEAVARIRQAKETGAEVLDLGDLALERLPDELGELTGLRVLALGMRGPRWEGGELRWEFDDERHVPSFADLGPLASLTSLQSLDLTGCGGVEDVRPLASLTSLQSLSLYGCEKVVDVNLLSSLTSLQYLNLSVCKGVADVSVLSSLTSLQHLNLSWCKAVTDVRPLSSLTSLQSLSLYGCEKVVDLNPLSSLTSLQYLDLSRCVGATDVSPLVSLTALQSLRLSLCIGVISFAPLLQLLPHFAELYLHGCFFHDLPPEVCGTSAHDNVIDAVRAHFADLDHALTTDPELKLFLLGNGGVGKTQLCNRLRDFPFDPSISSTHGILTHDTPLTVPGLDSPVRLHLWDFGGQDVYHGSHSLFLHAHALTLLLWHPDRESGFWREPNSDLCLNQRPLTYWLDYVRGLVGTADPLLLIQSQCDEPEDERELPVDRPTGFAHLRTLAVSAKTDDGLLALRGAIQQAVRFVVKRHPPFPIGRGRIEVRDYIRQMRADDALLPAHERKHRTLSRAEFDALCAENGKISNPSALLDFFHQTGVVFYRPGLVDRVIVDLSWAFEAVYSLLHRVDTLPALRALRGRFTLSTLRGLTVWQSYTPDEQRLFLDVMVGCGICFAIERRNQETEYVAPELLPEWSAVQREVLGPLQHKKSAIRAEVRYRYLHEGIQRAFLSRVGTQAQDAPMYWKYGLWLYDRWTDSQVSVETTLGDNAEQPGEGTFTFQAWGREPGRLIETLLDSLLALPIAHAPEITRHGYDPDHLDRHEPHELQATAPPSGADNPQVFISYAWGDDKEYGELREAVVDRLCERLRAEGYAPMRDKEQMRPGDRISEFMKCIGRGSRVVVVLSEKYLRSPYCMTELFLLFQDCRADRDEFRRRVKPIVLGDAKIDHLDGRVATSKYWEQECVRRNAIENAHQGPNDKDFLELLHTWHRRLPTILDDLRDLLCSRLAGPADIERGVADVLAMFRRQA